QASGHLGVLGRGATLGACSVCGAHRTCAWVLRNLPRRCPGWQRKRWTASRLRRSARRLCWRSGPRSGRRGRRHGRASFGPLARSGRSRVKPKRPNGGNMRATIGDLVHTHGVTSNDGQRTGKIVEVRGANDGPPYLVRFTDGEERLIYPGPNTVVEPQRSSG